MSKRTRSGRRSAAIVAACLVSGWARAQGLENLVQGGCGTMSRWESGESALVSSGCPGQGACDNPAIRDQNVPSASAPHLDVALQINVLCTNAGVCPFTPAQVDSAILLLEQDLQNVDFTPYPARITFTSRVRFIHDSRYTTLANLSLPNPDDFPMKDQYATDPAGHLNIWVTNILGTGFRGLSTFPWSAAALTKRGGILLDVGEFNNPLSGTFAHEMGHALGLWHVFRGGSSETPVPCTGCWENHFAVPPAPDQDFVGDFCKDTGPTDQNFTCFYSINHEPCFGYQYGPFGGGVYANYMQSSPFPEGGCRNHYTKEQAGRMRCWLQNATPGWLTVERDHCEDAVEIGPGTYLGTTRGFTNSGVASTCDLGQTPQDVWYRYDATVTRAVTLSTCGSGTSFDAQVSVTTDCGDPVDTEVSCSSGAPLCGNIGQHGRLTFTATAGTSYFIRVAHDQGGGFGDFELVLCEGTNMQCNRKIKQVSGPVPLP